MNPLTTWRRLRGKSLRYIASRGFMELRRAVGSPVQRRRLQRITSDDVLAIAKAASATTLVREWAARGPHPAARERERIARWYATRPEAAAALRSRGTQALDRVVDFLGSGPRPLGRAIPWCSDFTTGHAWPLTASDRLDFALLHLPCDVKVPWELSRFQHAFPLGQIWLLDRDVRAPREWRAQVESWDAANPVGLGPNWACTMDVALRAYSLLWLAAAFADAPELDETFWRRVVRMLWQHGQWMPDHLEIGEVNGNHYISDALGILAVGRFFAGTPAGARWMAQGQALLEGEIRNQIEPDGVDIEASVPYQRLVLEIFVAGRQLLTGTDARMSAVYDERIAAATRYVSACVTPEGLTPVVGDADDGRVIKFGGQDVRDQRYLIDLGAALTGNARRAEPVSEEAVWFLDERALAVRDAAAVAPTDRSAYFPDGGVAVLRSADQYCFVDVGAVGLRGRGGHGHNDALSFEWHAFGRPVLTDSGAFVYTSAPEWRNRFRSTEFHTALRVDGEELNRFFGPLALWTLQNDARIVDPRFAETADAAWVEAGHVGYERLADPVGVRRRVTLSRAACELTVRDEITAKGAHLVEWFFQVAPEWSGKAAGAALVLTPTDGRHLVELRPAGGASGTWSRMEGWFSPSYGVRVPRERWKFEARTDGAAILTWTLTARAAAHT